MLTELHVVSHTHWDREWYHTAERFRQRLVALMDELLDDPPPARRSFLLDGQAILLDDYLAVRPERAAELSTLLRDGRMEAGPWYVLADELIPSGEALVRNLLLGRDTVRRLRGEPPPVLYCPDSFGHPAILPELARGFGCELVVLWRGYGGARWPSGDVARWRGPTGAQVLLYHLPPDGYEFGSALPTDDDAMRTRWSRIRDVMSPRAIAGVALLLNGADHHARQRKLDVALDMLARAAKPVRVQGSSLRDASHAIVAAASRVEKIAEITGELRDSHGYTWTLGGTLGTRAAQKRANAEAERDLLRDVEPWVALAALRDPSSAATLRALLDAAWRTLLEAHPHDTLCGTSVDAVARAMDERLERVREQCVGLRERALQVLIAHDAQRAREEQQAWKPAVLIRNRAARARGGVVELTLCAKLADVAVGPGSATRQGARRRLPPWRVDGMPLQILARAEHVELTEAPRSYPDADLVADVRAVGWMASLGGYALATIPHGGARATTEVPNPVSAGGRWLDNALLRVEVSDDGRVSLTDRVNRRTIDDLISFERAKDVGDLYTPAIRETLDAPRVRRVSLVHRGPLRGELALELVTPATRGAAGRMRVALQLDADASFLRVSVQGVNIVRDQRLRVRIATGLDNASTLADAAFHPVSRSALRIATSDEAMEHVVPTAPLHRYVTRFSADAGCTLISDGLAEYESLADGSIAVTIVRSVGELSRADLAERPGHAGWPRHTPGAQCIGPFAASFAVAMHGADSPRVRHEIERLADDALLPLTGETLRSNLGDAGISAGITLVGDALDFSAAKPAREPGWIVLRCVNRAGREATGEWRVAHALTEARYARLDETIIGAPLSVRDGAIAFTAGPMEIVTILAR